MSFCVHKNLFILGEYKDDILSNWFLELLEMEIEMSTLNMGEFK